MRGNVRSAARTLSFALPLIVMIAALGLVVDAASGSSKKLNCGLGNGKKASGKAINVGAVVQASGGIDFSSASKGSAAFFACVNANGGINGRRVNFLVEDGGSDPAKTGAAAAKLVDDEKVVALVGSTSLLDCGVNGNFYNKRRVLVIAGVGAPRECFNTRNIAPVNTGPRLGAVASAQWAHEKYGAKKFVVLVYGLPSIGDWVSDGVSQYAKTIGGSSTKILFAPGVPDPQSIVLQASALNPDAIILVPAVQDTVALLKAADAQGLRDKYRWVCLTPCYDESFPAAAGPPGRGSRSTPSSRCWMQRRRTTRFGTP